MRKIRKSKKGLLSLSAENEICKCSSQSMFEGHTQSDFFLFSLKQLKFTQ